jgi:inosine-uridine nucleoside N-ribohydrolase
LQIGRRPTILQSEQTLSARAGHSPTRSKLLGISTVHGNQSIDKVTLNAAKYAVLPAASTELKGSSPWAHDGAMSAADLTSEHVSRVVQAAGLAGKDGVHIYEGASSPLVRAAKHDPEIHGESGLCGTDRLPAREDLYPDLIREDKAVRFLPFVNEIV